MAISELEIPTVPVGDTELKKFSPADAVIAKMAAEYLPLAIRDVNDSVGAKIVHEARMVVKSHRVDVEKTRKALKADALEFGRKVDAEAKRIVALLTPIEQHLSDQESAYEEAKEAIRNAARLKAEAEERAKQEAEEARLKAEREAEGERLRVEREKLQAEREAMEAERSKIAAEQEAERAKLRAAQEKIDNENRRLEAIETARLRKIEDERIAAEAAERSRIETERRIAREAEKKKAAEAAAEAARIKAESLRPEREKLLGVAVAIAAIPIPKPSSEEGRLAASQIINLIASTDERIREIVAEAMTDFSDLV
ncbi:MAG TPA: hypothetical protein VMY37_00885 [Thermoguttaceae bacterium]|nr:hypothetical protein [Thermoguttaceae bacterium]